MFLGFFPKWCSAVVVRMKRLVGRDPKGNVSFPLRAGRPDLRSAAGSRSKARTNWWLFPPLSRDDAATCFVSAVACLLACCLLACCLLACSLGPLPRQRRQQAALDYHRSLRSKCSLAPQRASPKTNYLRSSPLTRIILCLILLFL